MNEEVQKKLNEYQVAKIGVEEAETYRLRVAIELAEAVSNDDLQTDTPKRKRKSVPPRDPQSETNGAASVMSAAQEKTLAKYLDFVPSTKGCACGCGAEPVKGQKFCRGHWNALATIAGLVDSEKVDFETIAPQGWNYVSGLPSVSDALRLRCKEAHEEKVGEVAVE